MAIAETTVPVPHRPRIRFPFVARIVTAMLLGGLVGWVFGKRAEWLGDFGKVIIDLIKALAGPLLFFAVIDAFLRTRVKLRSAALMVAISLTNAMIAVAIGLTLSNTLKPGSHVTLPSLAERAGSPLTRTSIQRIDFVRELTGYLPKNVVQPFLENSVITIVVLAVLAGMALRRVKTEQTRAGETGFQVVESLVGTAFRTIEVILGWVIAFVPLAVFGVVARTIGQEGFAWIGMLGWYLGVAILGLAIQVFVVYLDRLWREDVAACLLGRGEGRRGLRARFQQQSGDPADHSQMPGSHEGLSAGRATRRLRGHESEQRRHPALRGDGRAVRRPGVRD